MAMPISGYLLSAAGGHPVTYFGLFTLIPGLPKNEALSHGADWFHVMVGQCYALILLHVAGTGWHVSIRRDGALERMLPEQNAPF
jgi:cytochrome b561